MSSRLTVVRYFLTWLKKVFSGYLCGLWLLVMVCFKDTTFLSVPACLNPQQQEAGRDEASLDGRARTKTMSPAPSSALGLSHALSVSPWLLVTRACHLGFTTTLPYARPALIVSNNDSFHSLTLEVSRLTTQLFMPCPPWMKAQWEGAEPGAGFLRLLN